MLLRHAELLTNTFYVSRFELVTLQLFRPVSKLLQTGLVAEFAQAVGMVSKRRAEIDLAAPEAIAAIEPTAFEVAEDFVTAQSGDAELAKKRCYVSRSRNRAM